MSNPVKLLECIRQGQIGGGESHLLSLVQNLDRTRFEPVVLSFTDGPMVERLKEMGVRTHIIPTVTPFDVRVWKSVKRLLQEEGVMLVHAHGTRAGSNVMWACRSLGIPVVYTIHGWSFHPDQSLPVRRMRMMGEQYLVSRSTVNIAVSDSNRQTGVENLRNFKAVVINNGIDQRRFDPSREFPDLRAGLSIPKGVVLILFLARFTAHKQPLTLIRAFREALPELPGVHLLLVGDGDQKEAALEMVKESGLNDRVHFQPFRQDVPGLLAAADIYVLPSLWEGLPIGLLEAMAMGKAVIATNVDGTREIIRDGLNGLLVEPGNSGVLADALMKLCKDGSLRAQMGRAAAEKVRAQYEAGGMTRKIEEIYSNILERP